MVNLYQNVQKILIFADYGMAIAGSKPDAQYLEALRAGATSRIFRISWMRSIRMIKPWNILETKYLYPGIQIDQCELPSSHILDCQLFEYDDEILIFAVTKKKEVVLIRQYRHGAQKLILELLGGSVDDNESPMEAGQIGEQSVHVAQAEEDVHRNRIRLTAWKEA